MAVSMQVSLGGIFAPGAFPAFRRQMDAEGRKRVATGMKVGGRVMVEKVRVKYATSVKISKRSFPKAIGSKVFDKKSNELPALWIGSKVKAVAAHAFGATIEGPVLIPLVEEGKRMGRKRFAAVVRELMRAGNAGFRTVNGKTILFAENLAANSKGLTAFRQAERARTGAKRFARSYEFPIAVLVRNVHVKKQFNFAATVQSGLPDLSAAIQNELKRT